jgi:hypothetical protein
VGGRDCASKQWEMCEGDLVMIGWRLYKGNGQVVVIEWWWRDSGGGCVMVMIEWQLRK